LQYKVPCNHVTSEGALDFQLEMAKFIVVALCLATLLVAASAAEDTVGDSMTPTRKLLQGITCASAPAMLKPDICKKVQECATAKAPSVATANNIKIFQALCGNCVAAIRRGECKGQDIPADCRRGLVIPVVAQCFTTVTGR